MKKRRASASIRTRLPWVTTSRGGTVKKPASADTVEASSEGCLAEEGDEEDPPSDPVHAHVHATISAPRERRVRVAPGKGAVGIGIGRG